MNNAETSDEKGIRLQERQARTRLCVRKGKTRITIRLDDDVLDWFREQVERAGGGSSQNLINDALRDHIRRADKPLEETLRRVVREELRLAE